MSLGKVWIGHKLSRRMPLVNWQRLQEIGFYLSTLCEFCFWFGFRIWLWFRFRFWLISYAALSVLFFSSSKIPHNIIWCFIFSTANGTQIFCSSCSSLAAAGALQTEAIECRILLWMRAMGKRRKCPSLLIFHPIKKCHKRRSP